MYIYETEKPFIFTERGQVVFLKIRDRCERLLRDAGAMNMECAIAKCSGNSWSLIACVDRLVELGEIREIKQDDTPGQYRIFVKDYG